MFRELAALMLLVALSSAALTMNTTVKKKFLSEHNTLRRNTGAGMPPLTWSNTLASYAASRVNKCVYEHDSTHRYGENLFWYSSTIQISALQAAEYASRVWGDEIRYKDPNWNCCYDHSPRTCGHYCQQVWNTTTQIGCAINVCNGDTLVFCEYSPPGNIIMNGVRQPPY